MAPCDSSYLCNINGNILGANIPLLLLPVPLEGRQMGRLKVGLDIQVPARNKIVLAHQKKRKFILKTQPA